MNKKAFTLTELIISIMFIAVIFMAAISVWSVTGKVFRDSSAGSVAYNDARAFETMLVNAASVAPDFIFATTLDDEMTEAEEEDYFAFFYDEDEGSFAVKYTAPGGGSVMKIAYETLTEEDDIVIELKNVRPVTGSTMLETRLILRYEIGRNSDGSPIIAGAVAMADQKRKNFGNNSVIPQVYRNSKYTLKGEILYLEWGDLDE